MIELSKGGAYLVDGVDVIEESAAQQGALAALNVPSASERMSSLITDISYVLLIVFLFFHYARNACYLSTAARKTAAEI